MTPKQGNQRMKYLRLWNRCAKRAVLISLWLHRSVGPTKTTHETDSEQDSAQRLYNITVDDLCQSHEHVRSLILNRDVGTVRPHLLVTQALCVPSPLQRVIPYWYIWDNHLVKDGEIFMEAVRDTMIAIHNAAPTPRTRWLKCWAV